MKYMCPKKIISLVNSIFGRYAENSGGCLKFHALLCEIFPNSRGFYNGDHILTQINGKYWDIDGEYTGDMSKYLPIDGVNYYYSDILEQFDDLLSTNEKNMFK